jgi:hypothetical protein
MCVCVSVCESGWVGGWVGGCMCVSLYNIDKLDRLGSQRARAHRAGAGAGRRAGRAATLLDPPPPPLARHLHRRRRRRPARRCRRRRRPGGGGGADGVRGGGHGGRRRRAAGPAVSPRRRRAAAAAGPGRGPARRSARWFAAASPPLPTSHLPPHTDPTRTPTTHIPIPPDLPTSHHTRAHTLTQARIPFASLNPRRIDEATVGERPETDTRRLAHRRLAALLL